MNVDPNKIQAMIAILQSMLEPSNDSTVTEEKNTVIETKSIIKKDNNWNKFEKMMEKNMHKEDIAIDKQLSIHPPVPRTRSYDPVDVKCRICGKTEHVNPNVITTAELDRYKCNRCSVSPG